MPLTRSIQHQVLISLLVLSLSLTLVFSGVVLITAFAVEDALLYRLLDQQVNVLEQRPPSEKTLALPKNMHYYPSLESAPTHAQQKLSRPQQSGEIFTADNKHYQYRKVDIPSGQAYLIADVSSLLVVSRQPGLFVLCAVGLALALAGAVWLALILTQRIVSPILSLTNAAKAAEKSQTPPLMPELPHELGYLANRMQQSFSALHNSLEKEKAFATNVSHELRTPLAVIRNACSLVKQRGYTVADLDCIRHASEQMQRTIDALLALARAESIYTQPCNLAHHLEQQLLSSGVAIPEHWQVTLELDSALPVNANPKLLDLLLINLIHNALEHSSEPRLLITADNHSLSFINPATPSTIQDHTAAGAHKHNSKGIGQGLYLVSRIAENQKWSISVACENDRFKVSVFFG